MLDQFLQKYIYRGEGNRRRYQHCTERSSSRYRHQACRLHSAVRADRRSRLPRPTDLVQKGDKLDLIVLRVNDVEGTVMLSKKRLDAIAGFEKIAERRARAARFWKAL